MNLQDLLNGVQDPSARYGGGAGVTAAAPSGVDPAIEAQIQALSHPDPVVEQPVPDKSKLWQRILSAVADGATAYSAGMGAGRGSNFSERLLERDRSRDVIAAGNRAAKSESLRKSQKTAAELRLQALLRQGEQGLKETTAKAVELRRQEDIAREEAKFRVTRENQLADMATRKIDEQAQAVRDQKYAVELQNLRDSHKDPDEKKAKQGEKDQKSYATGVRDALSLIDGNDKEQIVSYANRVQRGEDPKAVADELRQRLAEELDADEVFGKGRDMAHEFFNRKLMRAYQDAIAAPQQ